VARLLLAVPVVLGVSVPAARLSGGAALSGAEDLQADTTAVMAAISPASSQELRVLERGEGFGSMRAVGKLQEAPRARGHGDLVRGR